ncbi:LysR family transcriptional regulator [Duganella sp. FT50W]|uniref:LysR family transcriptional regulator n=1 Tax=Duganella lactea TaxID=2692173 RepID=A0A6L8MKB5_9BURK|nr:LysR family transcriptional regulator [Duganella lactea]MYM80875.1 LysR family transcriptional regulator [Duganella lactea]
MQISNLNDLALFAAIVKAGSITAAASATGQTKSKISRRLAVLEEQLGLRLIQRSTRAVHVTEVGADFFKYCEAMLEAAQGAMNLAKQAIEQPRGLVRVSTPAGLAHLFLADLLPGFLLENPEVQVALELTNRRVDLIREGFDIALRVRTLLSDSELILRSLGTSPQVLVASPAFAEKLGSIHEPSVLDGVVGLGASEHDGMSAWLVKDAKDKIYTIPFKPALRASYGPLLIRAVLQGVGVAQLPLNLCHEHLQRNELVLLLPKFRLPEHQLHLVYGSSKGLSPAVRVFADYLVEHLRPQLKHVQDVYKSMLNETPATLIA